jgi:mono/diheme cytochrome c family protein
MDRFFTGLLVCMVAGSAVADDPVAVEFDRDIRPILSSHCYQCHGPDPQTREAGLRLDTRAGLFGLGQSDRAIVVPREPGKSEIVRRIVAKNEDERMPPRDGGKPLSDAQIKQLTNWVQQGAEWRRGWSLEPIQRPAVPVVDLGPVQNPIDAFLAAAWKTANVNAVKETDPATLMRRLSFDLTGLPPSVPIARVTGAASENDYLRDVDRLLASPQFGERMAVYWLDLVRYADSCGYHSDVDQPVSPYRDYVIGAFNRNLPFDQFTREQLAGDLLPGPSLDQQIATGFNRLSKSTEEGGAQEGEYLAKAFADRVRTVSGAWLALTFGCAECHDHKFDPITTRDFYSLGAFFADVKERGVYSSGAHEPELLLPTRDETARLEAISAEIARLKESRSGAETLPSDQGAADHEKEIKKLEQQKREIEKQISRTLVTVSVPPRPIRVLPRGDWLNQSGDLVEPAFPQGFPQPDSAGGKLSRLDLADWLVRRDNPLTSRVFVNRLWKLFFGAGLTRTLDDFGAQGEPPSHPELLDWLAVEFMESGWDIKHMVRLLVTSRAYRLSSVPTNQLLQQDPQNRLFARQSRWRLDAEFVRDNGLKVSGLLVDRIGGPSVKPYQPDGYWEFLNFPKRTWSNSMGRDQYRRGLYTHWQRTFLHPSLLAFDAPSREECTASRMTSNTPKSSLALLNVQALLRWRGCLRSGFNRRVGT